MKILIVDDNAVNARVLQRMVEKAGGNAACVADGKKAVEYLEMEKPDLIFMDLNMPIMNGHEATRLIREKFDPDELPIFAVTANVTSDSRQQCKADGFNDFISKPINRKIVQEVISGDTA